MTTNNKKYKIRHDLVNNLSYRNTFRIEALRDFEDVSKGDIGGYIETENNLSHEGNCWVYDNATILNNTRVCDNAYVAGRARIAGNSIVCGNAHVTGRVKAGSFVRIFGNAVVCDDARIYGRAQIFGNAIVGGNTEIFGGSCVYGYAKLMLAGQYGQSWIYGPDPNVDCFKRPNTDGKK